jgi:murein DD-endopeptidase MepM/ murein hydrolase activator NlpD
MKVLFLRIAVVMLFITTESCVLAQGFLTLPVEWSGPPFCDFDCYPTHNASDYSFPKPGGENVYATAGGSAKAHYYANTDGNGNYGYMITITHQNGYETRYAHLQSYASGITNDQGNVQVKQGQLIGYVGNSGGPWKQADETYKSPYHLHFEVRKNGTTVDPYDPNNWLWTTNPPSLVSQQQQPTDYLGLKQNNERDQRVIDFYNTHGGASTFGQVWGNPNSYLHLWPDHNDIWVQNKI